MSIKDKVLEKIRNYRSNDMVGVGFTPIQITRAVINEIVLALENDKNLWK